MAESRALAYKQKLDELMRLAKQPTAEAVRVIDRLLAEMSREISADLVHADPTSYNAARLKDLKAAVERATQDFQRQASSQLATIEQKAYTSAAASVDAAVAGGTGGIAVHAVVDAKALGIVQGYTADLITGLARDTASRINLAIQRAYMGGSTLTDLVNQVGSALEGGKFSGIYGPVGDRAIGIATNEVMRVHSIASQSRIEDLASRHPELGKQWKHVPIAMVPRVGHLLVDGQVRRAEQPFNVEGEELMYPRDPSGSAENTINCHCLELPHLPPESLKPTDRERALLEKLGISVSTARQ